MIESIEIDGKIYFQTISVSKFLGLQTRMNGELKIRSKTNGGVQNVGYLSERQFYRLILKSRKSFVSEIKESIIEEILPFHLDLIRDILQSKGIINGKSN